MCKHPQNTTKTHNDLSNECVSHCRLTARVISFDSGISSTLHPDAQCMSKINRSQIRRALHRHRNDRSNEHTRTGYRAIRECADDERPKLRSSPVPGTNVPPQQSATDWHEKRIGCQRQCTGGGKALASSHITKLPSIYYTCV